MLQKCRFFAFAQSDKLLSVRSVILFFFFVILSVSEGSALMRESDLISGDPSSHSGWHNWFGRASVHASRRVFRPVCIPTEDRGNEQKRFSATAVFSVSIFALIGDGVCE